MYYIGNHVVIKRNGKMTPRLGNPMSFDKLAGTVHKRLPANWYVILLDDYQPFVTKILDSIPWNKKVTICGDELVNYEDFERGVR